MLQEDSVVNEPRVEFLQDLNIIYSIVGIVGIVLKVTGQTHLSTAPTRIKLSKCNEGVTKPNHEFTKLVHQTTR